MPHDHDRGRAGHPDPDKLRAGATSYRVYVAPPPSGCAGPFGLAGTIGVTGTQLNNDVSGCPFGSGEGNGHGSGNGNNGNNCSLGGQDAVFDSTIIGLLFAPNALAAPGTLELIHRTARPRRLRRTWRIRMPIAELPLR